MVVVAYISVKHMSLPFSSCSHSKVKLIFILTLSFQSDSVLWIRVLYFKGGYIVELLWKVKTYEK